MGLNRMDSSLLQSPSDGEMHLQSVSHFTPVLGAVLPAMLLVVMQLLLCRGCARPLSYKQQQWASDRIKQHVQSQL